MILGFFVALQLFFLVLKFFDVVAWSWWLIMSPVIAFAAVFVGLCLLIAASKTEGKRNGDENQA